MPVKAVLFDFDGVMAATENHHVAAWQRTLSAMGWQIPDEIAARAAEVDDREFLSDLFTLRGVPVDKVDDWVRRKQLLTVQLLRASPRVYPGVVELVRALRGQVRLAVVSGTWRENIEAVLEAAGLTDAFETIVGKEDVTARKPAPEAYELALKRLRLSARSAVALEDSATGMASARAAGLRVIAVGHRRPFGDWVGDSAYISGFEPIEGLLEHLKLSSGGR
ncbi:MAG: HAD family hydrolase [Isosphaeraceae bacterium]